jgi:DNA replication and repair protein RecF
MQLSHLSLTNFRNFVRLETDLASGPTVVLGSNAQGKTSLLEAIHYLAGASSPHARRDRELINFLALDSETPFARIVAELTRADHLSRIEIRLVVDPPGGGLDGRLKKEILINGVKRRVTDLAGTFNAILFLPQDLMVVEGSPGDRRRHFDTTLAQADPVYAESLLEYAKLLSQRNALLKRIGEGAARVEELEYWDGQLAELAATLMRARILAIKELEAASAPIHQELTRAREHLRLVYLPAYEPIRGSPGQLDLALESAADRSTFSRETLRQGFFEALLRSRAEDVRRGQTQLGPHRDDVRFLVDGLDLHTYGSRGQIRTAMLALKLAEVAWLHQRTGEWPILLMDEVLAELDPIRRRDLLGRVRNTQQVVLTSTDLSLFDPEFLAASTVWQITAGHLSPLTA